MILASKKFSVTLFNYLVVLGFCLFIHNEIVGQSKNAFIDESLSGLSFTEFVKTAEEKYQVKIFYPPNFNINPVIYFEGRKKLPEILKTNLKSRGYSVSVDPGGRIFIIEGDPIKLKLSDDFFHYDKRYIPQQKKDIQNEAFIKSTEEFIAKEVTIGHKKNGINKKKARISGTIINEVNKLPVSNASLYFEETGTGTTTDDNGFYTIELPKRKYNLTVSYIENEPVKFKINLLSDGTLDIKMHPHSYLLNEVVISSEQDHNVRGNKIGFEKIDMESIKGIPVVLGENDIIKVALLLPGVQSVGEGSSGFNVRGSPVDQNLFYINEIPIYNTSHLMGFFSAFNSDAIDQFELYKGNIPLNFGGRLSSIFDIQAKTGNNEKFSARGGISPITARILAEGPIKKNKSSYIAGVRSTYSDWVLNMVKNHDINSSSVQFGDAIAGLDFKINTKDRLNLLFYGSYDKLNIAGTTKHDYENIGGAINWTHFFKDKHSLKLSYVFSEYDFSEENNELEIASYKQSYQLQHNELKARLKLQLSEKHTLIAGFNSILYLLDRGDYLPLDVKSIVKRVSFESEKSVESAIYLGDTWEITPLFQLSGGLRLNIYNYLGPKTVFSYLPDHPKTQNYITDTNYYGNNKIIKTYSGLDARIAARYIMTENLSFKASYNRLHQYIFLLSNTVAVSPTALWKLSDPHIKPMVGDQYTAGAYFNLFDNKIELSAETYYKKVKNLVEYKDGAEFVINEIPESDIIQGKLDAYGLELMLKKPNGKLNGWINYTISKANVQVIDEETGENNNFGKKYPANWDKPHAFNLVANYRLSRRLSFSGTLVYSTGRPVTYPTAVYYMDGMEVLQYSLRNEYRLPDYFRVDLSVTLEGNLLARKLAHGSFTFSVYNLTGRKNAYSVYFRTDNKIINAYKLSVFGVPIFSVTYNFKLGNYAD